MKTSKYKMVEMLSYFLRAVDCEERDDVDERKLNAMCEVLHNMRKAEPVISLDIVEKFIAEIDNVKDMERSVSIDPADLDTYFKRVITRRMCHCATNLLYKYKQASKTPSGEYVMFDDNTHFSKPVYEAMLQALETTHEKWNTLIWQQVVRQMHCEHSTDDEMFNIATEYFLVGNAE